MGGEAISLTAGFHVDQRRLERSGKRRYRVDIKTDDGAIDLDHLRFLAPVAEATLATLRKQFHDVTALASLATRKKRERARHPQAEQTDSYKRRYTGGRTGHTPPQPGAVRLFHDSGRLVNNMVINWRPSASAGGGVMTINVPANRLDETSWGQGSFSFQSFVEQLKSHIPLLRGDYQAPELHRAWSQSLHDILASKRAEFERKRARRNRLAFSIIKQALGL